jgi:hypothetical protein
MGKRGRTSLHRRSAIPSSCLLKPATPTVIPSSANEEKKNNDDEKCLGIHVVQSLPFVEVVSTPPAIHSVLTHFSYALIAVRIRLGIYSRTRPFEGRN